MGPRARRAFHEALDLILDAVAEDMRDAETPKRNRRKAPPPPVSSVNPASLDKARAALRKANLPAA